jgi:hypothetical protein
LLIEALLPRLFMVGSGKTRITYVSLVYSSRGLAYAARILYQFPVAICPSQYIS